MIEEMDHFPVFLRKLLYGAPHKTQVFPFFRNQFFIQFVRVADLIVFNLVLRDIGGDLQAPGLFVRGIFKYRGGLQILQERILHHILRVRRIVKVRVRQPQHVISVGVQKMRGGICV